MSIPGNIYKATLKSKKQLTNKVYELGLDLDSAFAYKAGQCVGFIVTDKYKRLYSMTSLPFAGDSQLQSKELTFSIDVSPMGPASQFILAMQPGQQFDIEGPYGGFVVNDLEKDFLFISTGVGVAPFQSIIPDLLQKGFSKKVTLLFGVRDEQDIFMHDFFNSLAGKYPNFEFIPMLSQAKGEWQGEKGRVTEHLQRNIEKYKNRLAYICGGTEMVKDVRSLLLSNGWTPKDIKLEIFI